MELKLSYIVTIKIYLSVTGAEHTMAERDKNFRLYFFGKQKKKSEIFLKISDFIFSTCRKLKFETSAQISDFIFLYAEKKV